MPNKDGALLPRRKSTITFEVLSSELEAWDTNHLDELAIPIQHEFLQSLRMRYHQYIRPSQLRKISHSHCVPTPHSAFTTPDRREPWLVTRGMLQIDLMVCLDNATALDTAILDGLSLVEIIEPLSKNVLLDSPGPVV